MPIKDYKKLAENYHKKLMNDPDILQVDKDNLQKYLDAIDIKPGTLSKKLSHYRVLFKTMPDIIGHMMDRDYVNQKMKLMREKYKPNFLQTQINVGRSMVRWWNDGDTPKGWKDVKSVPREKQKRDLRPEDMLTWEDGKMLADATNSIQIKAIIMVQLDGGFRPSEFVDIKFKDVKIKKTFAIIHIPRPKTGKPRDVILFKSVPYLQKWLNNHPKPKGDSPLWVTEYVDLNKRKSDAKVKQYEYPAIVKRLKYIKEKTGFKKPLDFYNMRHSACYLSKMDNITPDLAARKFGHSVKYYSETYARLSADDDIKRFESSYNLVAEEEKKQENKPIECIKCHTINEPGSEICEQCQNPLTMGKALERTQELEDIKAKQEEQAKMMDLLINVMRDGGSVDNIRKALDLAKQKG
jgi:integrase